MSPKEHQVYRCQNRDCGCEIVVTKTPVEAKGNPRCFCGAEMKKPYSPPVFRMLDPDDELVSRISALALLLAGAWLLHDGVSGRDLLQIEIIAGGTLLSVGVVCSVLLLRHWIKWRRELGKYREG